MTEETVDIRAQRPLPTPTPESSPYWEAARRHELVVQRCTSCGLAQFYPPRTFCRRCMSEVAWITCSGRATVVASSTVVRAPSPAFQVDAPYNVSLVQLEEGPRLITNVVNPPAEGEVPPGAAVEVIFDDVTDDVTLPRFRLV
jgi:uncharacterized OB-fold protein